MVLFSNHIPLDVTGVDNARFKETCCFCQSICLKCRFFCFPWIWRFCYRLEVLLQAGAEGSIHLWERHRLFFLIDIALGWWPDNIQKWYGDMDNCLFKSIELDHRQKENGKWGKFDFGPKRLHLLSLKPQNGNWSSSFFWFLLLSKASTSYPNLKMKF